MINYIYQLKCSEFRTRIEKECSEIPNTNQCLKEVAANLQLFKGSVKFFC